MRNLSGTPLSRTLQFCGPFFDDPYEEVPDLILNTFEIRLRGVPADNDHVIQPLIDKTRRGPQSLAKPAFDPIPRGSCPDLL